MADFNFPDIFGQFVSTPFIEGDPWKVEINVDDFKKQSLGGQLSEETGASFGHRPTATQMFYGILMMLMKNQGATVNTDPTQKIYITDAGKTIATGARDGQVRRSFTVSFYLDAGLAGIPSIDAFEE
ncbi:hypothetical protein C7B62_24490 [Pleurocapsa sp. CCALA 161]|uniref:hypothetical protein n=1 Tax=Pleurocapsa sp. CCALA 161 TaxID=2107688 RepID=UPI000D06D5E9|nr:hypothetical protein [Pleurocapsa sp. CCALA 161]PSB05760.1 hypothetical protein C7B62_24490 [Pleurocapsa sp. CCALA 161]